MQTITRIVGIVSSLFVMLSGIVVVGVSLFGIATSTTSMSTLTFDQLCGGSICALWFGLIPLMLVLQGGIGLLRSSRSDNP